MPALRDVKFDNPWTIFGLFIGLLYQLGLAAAVVAPLKIYVQGRPHNNRALCSARETSCGFVGNPDFYGLGIRVGVYLQWLTSLLFNMFLRSERRAAAMTYCVFSLALLVATFVITYQNACTFEAEIIVILFIYFGGVYNAVVPLVRQELVAQQISSLRVVFTLMIQPMMFYSSWFWVQLATGANQQFPPTPCGTSLFLFSHIGPSHIRTVSKFMAFLSVWASTAPAFQLITNLLAGRGLMKATFLVGLFAPDTYLSLFGMVVGFFVGVIMGLGAVCWGGRGVRWIQESFAPKADEVGEGAISIVIMVWSIIGVELTLRWNGVSDVYSIQSTGQLIPVSVGIGGLVQVLWRLLFRKKETTPDPTPDAETGDALQTSGSEETPNGSLSWTTNNIVNASSHEIKAAPNDIALRPIPGTATNKTPSAKQSEDMEFNIPRRFNTWAYSKLRGGEI